VVGLSLSKFQVSVFLVREEFRTYLDFSVKRYCNVYCTFCSELLINNKTYTEEVTKFIEESQKLTRPDPEP
jgi:hypothetical protein